MKNLIREIHRRSLWQVLGIYLAGSWIALQVVEQLTEAAGLPDWVRPFSLVLLILGFPIVMATAFVQEGMSAREPEVPKQSLADVGEVEPPPPPAAKTHHRVLTWRNAVIGGVAAFALLGILTAAYLFMRTAGIGPAGTLVAAGVLDERDPILIAEMTAGSGDAGLARTATEALRTDLAESPTVTLMSADEVSDALERMRRDPNTPLDIELAREVATREGVKAVVGGEVNVAGAGYVLTAQVISAADGSVLASRRESARDETEIIDAIDRLSKGVRERLGESLKSVQSSPGLARLTTGSLEALQKYQEGNAAYGRREREIGRQLMYEAVAIDTAFAAAWRRLATDLGNPGNPADLRVDEIEAATKGWVHRDRLTDFERVRAEAIYHRSVTGDLDRELAVYERAIEQFPQSGPLFNNLGVQYADLEEYEKSEEVVRRGIRDDPEGEDYFLSFNLLRSLVGQGRFDEAEEHARTVDLAYADEPEFTVLAPGARLRAEREWARLAALIDSVGEGPATAVAGLRGLVATQLEEDISDLADLDRVGHSAEYVDEVLNIAFTELFVQQREQSAIARVDEALVSHPLAEMHAYNRPYTRLAEFNARVGRTADARALLDEYETNVVRPLEVVWNRGWHRARSELALAEGRNDDAIAEQRLAEAKACTHRCPQLGRVYDLAGVPDSAIAVLGRYVDAPDVIGLNADAIFMAWALERLGQLHDERGELPDAAGYYARFVDLWAEADDDLQSRVRVAQSRLEEILREVG